MLTFPNSKINIGLYVTAKRPDGYHDLETVFYPIAIKDALEIIPAQSGASGLHMTGLPVAGDWDKNLAWKAYTLLQQDFPEKVTPLSIHLHKLIPMGAGLGGGSADGAFMLTMLNTYFDLRLSHKTLEGYALLLGSDCPFFIHNTAAFAAGRGELLEDISIDLSPYSIQLICPEIHISTAIAFSGIIPGPATFPLRNIAQVPLTDWKDQVSNDFEHTLFSEYPVLREVKEQLYAGGALYASLSGTGSSVYGIFPKGERASIVSGTPFTEHYIA